MKELQFLRQDECAKWAQQVLSNGKYLVQQGGFYTLGMPAYLTTRDHYPAAANTYNVMLWALFKPLYEGLRSAVSEHFDKPVGYMPDGVLMPSFHVFDEESLAHRVGYHVDDSHNDVPAFDNVEFTDPFTLTVPVKLPAGVNGLELDIGLGSETGIVEYSLGKMYIHDGQTPHRILRPDSVEEGETRITLQAHGIHTVSGIILFW